MDSKRIETFRDRFKMPSRPPQPREGWTDLLGRIPLQYGMIGMGGGMGNHFCNMPR
jgi:hypothetical protein